MTTIRSATPADATALARLRWEFRSDRDTVVESEQDFVVRCAGWMQQRLGPGSPWRVWVADAGGHVAGQIWLQLFDKLPNPNGEGQRHAYISNLYVQTSARGGVGSQLLDTALAYAKANGADRVLLWPSARSVTLYRRRGFSREAGVIELKL